MVWMLIGYMFLFVHRPFEIWPVLGTIRLERIYMLATLAVWAVAKGDKSWPSNSLNRAFLAFTAAVLVCFACSHWNGTLKAQTLVENYLKILVFYVIIVTTVRDQRHLEWLIQGFMLVMAIYMAHSLREYMCGRHVYRMGIPRMIAVGTSEADPNSFGATIAYALPLVEPLWTLNTSRRFRLLLIGYLALSVTCIGLTGSRSSFLMLLIYALITALRSRYRVRMLLFLVLVAPILWGLLPPSLQNRFTTIVKPEDGPKNAQVSAESRTEGFNIGRELWSKSPFVGYGPGAWIPATGRKIESHNLYGQVMGEMGTLGLVTFSGVLIAFWTNIRRIAAAYRDHPDWEKDFVYHLAMALGKGVLLMLIGGWAGHNLFRYSWLWYGGFLILARRCVEQRLEDEEQACDSECESEEGREWIGTLF